jgi:transcription initiation factor TFIIB
MINDNECWVCTTCGLEYEKYYESTSQTDGKRAYNMQERAERVTHEPRWRTFGPRTVIGEISNDIPAKKKAQFNRLKKIQGSLVNSLERNYWEALPKLNLLINKLSLSKNIHETAIKIYKEVARQKLTMGRSIDAFVAGSVYAAIRIQNSPRWLEEIISMSQLPTKSVSRSLSLIINQVLPKFDYKYKQLSPFVLVPRFIQELNIDFEYSTKAMELLKTAVHKGMKKMGKDPKGLAAAAIYLTVKYTNNKTSQSEIANVSKITEVTLRTRAREIKKYLR